MGMSLLDETFEVYVQMRIGGKEAKSALESLRARIETLQPDERIEMVRRVKGWEAGHHLPVSGGSGRTKERPPTVSEKTVPCPRCGRPNSTSEVFCVHCGNFLRASTSPHETTKLDDPDLLERDDFFGPETTLLLTVVPDNYTYQVQPQRFKHETVIGRSEGSTMKPDIDLSAHNAGDMGVSRLHVALQYNAKNNLLSVSDMKSANGTFINGQKLYPQEVRVLRDGDELRLGRLVLRTFFRHPDGAKTRQ